MFDFSIEDFILKIPLYLIEKINRGVVDVEDLQPEIDRFFIKSFPYIIFKEK